MTELHFSSDSIYDLQIDDEIWIGPHPYTIRKFTKGGMGIVIFAERNRALQQEHSGFIHGHRVAIKAVLASDDSTFADLFHRELTVWAGFDHPNIVGLNEILHTQTDGCVAAMNWHEGSLRHFMDTHGPISVGDALFILRDIISGLDHALQSHNAMHLDLKPGNILYGSMVGFKCFYGHDTDPVKVIYERSKRLKNHPVRQYAWQVSDWGLASVKAYSQHKQTSNNRISTEIQTMNNRGTTAYMAPERFIQGVQSSIASDMYAIGLLLFEMMIGKLPFQSQNEDLIHEICSHDYFHSARASLKDHRFERPVAEIILSLLAPDPSRRCSSYSELLEKLANCGETRSFLSRAFNL
jgi:serine/threonine-protein kinase